MKDFKESRSDNTRSCHVELDTLVQLNLNLLGGQEKKLLLAHLESCVSCEAILKGLKAMTRKSTEEFFSASGGCQPDAPFPKALTDRISGFDQTTSLARLACALRKPIEEAGKYLKELAESIHLETLDSAVTSMTRRPTETIRIDIVNLTQIDLDESRLRPVITAGQWRIAGFSEPFKPCCISLLLAPESKVRAAVPGWDRVNSQNQLIQYFTSHDPAETILEPFAALRGQFVAGSDEQIMEVNLDPDIRQWLPSLKDLVSVILILPENQ